MINLTLIEIMRRNMVEFSRHFITHKTMTKNEFFKIQKAVIKQMEKENDKH
jgi:hypothetical protein